MSNVPHMTQREGNEDLEMIPNTKNLFLHFSIYFFQIIRTQLQLEVDFKMKYLDKGIYISWLKNIFKSLCKTVSKLLQSKTISAQLAFLRHSFKRNEATV